jgi:sarcosine oxidase subunit beta
VSLTLETDVIIVGGGIVGASAALMLALRGQRVVLLERDFCGSRSSGVNYGGVRRQGRSLVQLPLSQRAHELWSDLPGLIGIDGEYVRSGHLKLARSDADMAKLQAWADAAADFDLGVELLDYRQLRGRFAWVGDVAVGASLCHADGHANPRLVSPAFAAAARRAGARIVEQVQPLAFEHDGRAFQVSCSNGERLRAPWLLNCAGAWANHIAEQFGEHVPMTSGHPAMLVTEPLPLVMDVSTGVEGGGIYARQVARGNCVLGGGQGFALDPLRARPGQLATLDILRNAVELYPFLQGAQAIRTWSGTEGYLPDREPIIGHSVAQPGLIHAFGFAGAGFQIGPAVGEALAQLIVEGRSQAPIDAFSIQRFSPLELHTGRSLS